MDDNKRYFQWIKGDKIGKIEIFKETKVVNGISFILFESNARINEKVLPEFLQEVDKEFVAGNYVDERVINFDSNILNNQNINNTNTNTTFNTNNNTTFNTNNNIGKSSVTLQKSPVRILLEKQLESNNIEINIPIKAFTVKPDVFNILHESFGDEALDELINIIFDSLDKQELNKLLKESVLYFYNKHNNQKTYIDKNSIIEEVKQFKNK